MEEFKHFKRIVMSDGTVFEDATRLLVEDVSDKTAPLIVSNFVINCDGKCYVLNRKNIIYCEIDDVE